MLSPLIAFFEYKMSLISFPVLFIVICGVAVYMYNKTWKEDRLYDKMGRNFKYSDKISPYGGAHVMEPYEYVDVAQIRKVEDCKGVVVGQLTEDGEECVDFNAKRINTHMYVTATSGSGKTYGFVKPYIFQAQKRRHSIVMTDPKGELYSDMAGFLQDNGYIVRRLDFKNLKKSDGWDCLKLLRGENMRTKTQIFTNAVISNINPNDSNSIFATGSDALLQALILRVLLGHDYPESERNIHSVYDLLQNPGGYEFIQTVFDKNVLTEEEMPCLPPYLVFAQSSENLRSNIATHLSSGLQLFQDADLCRVLSTDDIDLTLPGKQPCAYFCVFPDDHDTYRFVISLFFTMFFIELVDYADAQPNRKLPVPVDFLLDEFPSIGIIPDWAKKMSTIRSRAISAVMITQDFTQLKQNYKETWPTILNNCGALVTLGINEMETADWISKRIGETSIEVESTSESEVAGRKKKDLVKKNSIGVGKRSLFTSSEIFEIGQDNNLVIIAGRNPIFSNKTPYTIFKDSEKLRDIALEDLIDIDNEAERKLFHDAEREYIQRYWDAHNKKMIGDASDLSDAMYTEQPEEPLAMVFSILKDDAVKLIHAISKKVANQKSVSPAKEVVSDSEAKQPEEKLLSNDTVEKGAFLEFYEQYKEAFGSAQVGLDSASAESTANMSDYDSFLMDDTFEPSFNVNFETGEVEFFDNKDKALGDNRPADAKNGGSGASGGGTAVDGASPPKRDPEGSEGQQSVAPDPGKPVKKDPPKAGMPVFQPKPDSTTDQTRQKQKNEKPSGDFKEDTLPSKPGQDYTRPPMKKKKTE